MEVIMFDYGVIVAKSIQQGIALLAIELMKLPGSSAGRVLDLIEEWEFSMLQGDEIDRKAQAVADKGNPMIHLLSFDF